MGESKCVVSAALAGLKRRIGTGGLIGAGIGLVYTPISMFLIGMAYNFEESTFVRIIAQPAVPFFFFAAWMELPEVPFFTISVVLFTLVGAGIGAGIHQLKKRIKKKS